MSRRPVRRALAIAVVALVLTPAAARSHAATAESVALSYDVYYLAFRVLAVDSTTALDPDSYRMSTHMRTVGLVGTLFPWEARSSVHGEVAGTRLVPELYELRSEFRGNPIAVDLHYDQHGAVTEQVSGVPFEEDRTPVPADLRLDTIDPLTAAIALSHALDKTGSCTGTRRVYDGVRRYDLQYEDLGSTELESSSRDSFAGPARLCRARVAPLGGFRREGSDASHVPSTLTAWLRSPAPGTAPVPLRLDIAGEGGTLHAYLQHVDVPPSIGNAPAPAARAEPPAEAAPHEAPAS